MKIKIIQGQEFPAVFGNEFYGSENKLDAFLVEKVRYVETSESGLVDLILNEYVNVLFGLVDVDAEQVGSERTGARATRTRLYAE